MSAAKIHLKRRRICDFCGKGEETARLLIVSPGDVADICDECVSVCAEVVAEYDAKKAATPQPNRGGGEDMSTAPEVFDRSNGHEWAHWHFKSMSMVCCNLCGIVRRADDKNKPCKGKVKVALRAS